MPHRDTVRRWLRQGKDCSPGVYTDFFAPYAHEAQVDMLAEEMLDVARAATPDSVNAAKLLIDTLKWRAARLRPRVYGDKIAIDAPPRATAEE